MAKRSEMYKVTAMAMAMDAAENYFSSRRGVWKIENRKYCFLYDNNPYTNYPDRRAEEWAEFRRHMEEAGIEELAFVEYPPPLPDQPPSDDDGYTWGMLIGTEDIEWIISTFGRVLQESDDDYCETESPAVDEVDPEPLGRRILRFDMDAPPSPN
jgi:hypothetical protein